MERLTAILIITAVMISTIIIFLVLVMRIRNRVHEAGVMLALGIPKSNVILQYFIEAGVLLLLSFITSYYVSTLITAMLVSYMQSLVNGITITILPGRLILQYFGEAVITGAAVLTAAMPVIRLNPKNILSKMS